MKTGSEVVAEYVIEGKTYTVYGCWDHETPDDEYEFYDVEVDGECINLGEPFYELPSEETVREYLEEEG